MIGLLLSQSSHSAEQEPLFQDDTFEDFRQGEFDGANIFASRKGDLRWLNWFDLNRDGWSEIVANNDHNHYETPDAFIYHSKSRGEYVSLYSPLREEMPLYQMLGETQTAAAHLDRLPSLGGGRSHIADLNLDGWPDIVFSNFIHGWSEAPLPVFIYWGGVDGYRMTNRSIIDAFRGNSITSADLDQDGLPDLIVSNGGREYFINKTASAMGPALAKLADAREQTSYVFRQSDKGFSNEERWEIPTLYAISVQSADFNRDGLPDIAFLEAGKPGRMRIFLNSKDGLSKKPQVLAVAAPTWGKLTREFLAADLDGDGWVDIFAPSEGGFSEIFWNGPEGFSEARKTEIPTANAYSAAASDLDGDGKRDLVVANYSTRDEKTRTSAYEVESTIFYGDGQRFAQGRTVRLPTSGATGVRIADLNGDTLPDIVFSQHRDDDSFDIASTIYWNSPKGFQPANRQFLGTFGAVDVQVIPGAKKGEADLFFSNRQSGYARYTGTSDAMGGGGGGDSLPHLGIFWGNPSATFGPGAMTMLPSATPETTLAFSDVNFDGLADLLYLRGRGDELRVRFGAPDGFSSKIASYPIGFRGKSLVVADFNRDGYVDVVVTSLDASEMAFLAGSAEGFVEAKKFPLFAGSQSVACGDFDADGLLDLVVVGKGYIQTIPGDKDAVFDVTRAKVIETTMFSSWVCVADLNEDGELDLFVQNFSNIEGTMNSTSSWVMFNSQGKFAMDRKLDVSTYGATGGSVADVNKDGILDLVVSNYHGDTTRHVSLFIYYGEGGGKFRTLPEKLPAYSSSANMVLDLNNDGFMDVVVYNHSESTESVQTKAMGGKHGTGSFIYWGSQGGFSKEKRSWFPTFGPHARINADPGSVKSRSSQETYTSRKQDLGEFSGDAVLTVIAELTKVQKLACEVDLGDGQWKQVSLEAHPNNEWRSLVTIPAGTRGFRYKLILDSGNFGVGPIVEKVILTSVH